MQVTREPRRKVMIRATMCAGGPWTDVCIRDISSRGIMAQTGAPPPRGTFIDLDWPGHQIVGLVVWRRERRFGIQIRERINVAGRSGRAAPETLAPQRRAPASPRAASRSGAVASRTLAGRMEFAVVAIFAAALVAGLGFSAFQALSRPLDTVSSLLGR
jgi:PilZ domain